MLLMKVAQSGVGARRRETVDTTTIHSNFDVRVTIYTDSTSDSNFSILSLLPRLRKSVLSECVR